MFRRQPLVLLASASVALRLAAASAQHSPYAGEQGRDINALSGREVADLLAGRGMGVARAAELNGYPGPMHVLELRGRLGLSPEQEAAVRASFARMEAAAKPLGAALVEHERALDRAFAGGAADMEAVRSMIAAIDSLQGRLRGVHLVAHVETRAVLTGDQARAYDALRGYSHSEGTPERHGGGQHGRPH